MYEPWLTKLLQMCFELLPQLHAVSPLKPEPHIFCKNLMQKLGTSTAKALNSLSYRLVPLNLRRLVLSGRLDYGIQENILFSELSELALYNVSMGEVMHILRRVGRQLTSLRLKVSLVVPLDRMFAECPNLIELSLNVWGMSNWSTILPQTLQRLQVLQIKYADDNNEDDDFYYNSPEVLPALLQIAPKLRSFCVFFDVFSEAAFQELIFLTRQRTCMHNLEELKVSILDSLNVGDDDQIKMFCDTCIIECYQLKNVKLEFVNLRGGENEVIDH